MLDRLCNVNNDIRYMGGIEMHDDYGYEKHIPVSLDNRVLRSSSFFKWKTSEVHLDRVGSSEAPVRMILIHGAGGNSSAMWPYAASFANLGAYVTVPDLPGYGKTKTVNAGAIRYSDWRQFLINLVEKEDDERPLVIMGASMGGMLAYDAAATTGLASRLIVTCLLDPRSPAVRERLTWHPYLAKIAGPALSLLAGPLQNVRLPLKWIADMRHISNDAGLVKEVISDKTGGGNKVSLGWMRSFLESSPLIEPEDFTGTTVDMIHPGNDRWTPLSISCEFFDRIAAKKSLTILSNCGHFPVEEPGFSEMLFKVEQIIQEVLENSK